MKRFLLTVFAATLCINEPSFAQDEAPFNASTSGDGSGVIAFVGKKIFVLEDETYPPKQDPEANEIIIHMDSRYKARYEIIDLIAGDYESKIIDFYAFDHYGIPKFSETEAAVLLFVHERPENFIHSKYNYYEIHRTTDGDWAACGNPYVQYDPEETEKEPIEALTFIEPVTVIIPSLIRTMSDFFDEGEIISDTDRAEAQLEIDEEYKEVDEILRPPIWKRDGKTATCLMGTRVKDLYEFQDKTRFKPDRRTDMCRARYSKELEALGEDYRAKREFMKNCTSLLEIQNLP